MLLGALPAHCAERLLQVARPAIGCGPVSVLDRRSARFGGLRQAAGAPPGWSWPTVQGYAVRPSHPSIGSSSGPCRAAKPSPPPVESFGDHGALMAWTLPPATATAVRIGACRAAATVTRRGDGELGGAGRSFVDLTAELLCANLDQLDPGPSRAAARTGPVRRRRATMPGGDFMIKCTVPGASRADSSATACPDRTPRSRMSPTTERCIPARARASTRRAPSVELAHADSTDPDGNRVHRPGDSPSSRRADAAVLVDPSRR